MMMEVAMAHQIPEVLGATNRGSIKASGIMMARNVRPTINAGVRVSPDPLKAMAQIMLNPKKG